MTSSLRNSIHRRNHKERSQLAHRSRLGILEKHADYVQRARDYHSKQDKLTRLRQKAAERNKDEFYFAMGKEKTQGGVHVQDRGNVALPIDIVKVLKTQDENYVRTMRAAGLKKIDKIKNQLMALADLVKPASFDHDVDNNDELDEAELEVLREAGVIARQPIGKGKGPPKHIIFVENHDEARQYVARTKTSSGREGHVQMSDLPEKTIDLGWKSLGSKKKSKKRNDTIVSQTMDEAEREIAAEEQRETAAQHRKSLLKELSARLSRDKQLRYAEREFEMQRLLMGKGARKKLSGVEKVDDSKDDEETDSPKDKAKPINEKLYKPRVYKWRMERKR